MDLFLATGSLLHAMTEAPRPTLVLVDDDMESLETLVRYWTDRGYRVTHATNGEEGLTLLDESTDVVLTSLDLPTSGTDWVDRGRGLAPHAVFLVMTEPGNLGRAVEAIRRGADQYLLKPLNLDAVTAMLEPAARRAAQHRELLSLRSHAKRAPSHQRIMGDHPLMQQLLKLIEQVAPRRASVLITGETGTGKELVARALHEKSGRTGSFVALNCAALAESVLESELFGHERGAFTGAMQRRDGRFKLADRGTLFLDEVSEIPTGTQVKLLRFLQEREYERVGSNRTERVDVRVVAACNVNLSERVAEGRFREDLFYRLNVIDIAIPPLRARLNDIATLAEHFVRRACAEEDRSEVPLLGEAVLERLRGYPWPGNVRELQNAMERAVAVCAGNEIALEHLPGSLRDDKISDDARLAIPGMTLAELERFAVLRTLEAVQWSPAKAAHILGVSTRTVQYRLKEWHIDRAELSQQTTDDKSNPPN